MAAGGETPLPTDRDAGEWMRDIERRLRELEGARSMQATVLRGGSFRLVSPTSGETLHLFGEFGDGTTIFFGDVVYDGDGRSVVMVRDDIDGLVKPDIPFGWSPAGAFITVSSASYVPVYVQNLRAIYHNVIVVEMTVTADPGTVGAVRLREANSGAVTGDYPVPDGTQRLCVFKWLHGRPIGDDAGAAALNLVVEAKRVSGAGNVNVYEPTRTLMTSSPLIPEADADGDVPI